jgi:CubicO group peptidase (beta-lactamase class C family)
MIPPRLLALALLGLSAGCTSVSPPFQSPEDGAVEAYFDALTAMDQFNGVVLAAKNGEVVHLAAYNMDRPDLPSLAVTTESQFDLRSVTKLLARLAVYQLEAEGRLELDDPVSRHIDGLPYGDRITIRHLMTNSSGLPREFTTLKKPPSALGPDDILRALARETLAFEPGSQSRYSNTGFQLLYLLIGEIAGESFVSYVEDAIFEPAGMTRSGAHFGGESEAEDYAFGHYLKDGTLTPVLDFPEEDIRTAIHYSTARDMQKFLRFAAEGPHADKLASDGVIAHAGGTRGKRAYVETDLGEAISFVVLANYDGIPFSQINRDMRAMLTGGEYEIPAPINRTAISLPPETLSRYEGVYTFREIENLQLVFRVESGRLVVYQNGERAGVLKPESETVFFEDPEAAESMTFEQADGGSWDVLMDWQGVRWRGEQL